MSPWGDLAGEGVTHKENLYKDPMFGISPHSWKAPKNAAVAVAVATPAPATTTPAENSTTGSEKPKKSMTSLYAGDTDVHEPYLSPVFGSYDGFPPMLIQVGSFEVLQSDSETIYQKARNAGVDATLSVFNGMYHVFQQAGEFIPEGKKAWKEIAAFCNRQ